MSIDYIPPPGGALDPAQIQAAVNAYLTVYPPGIPDHADLPDTDTDGHPASAITGLATVATTGSFDDLTDTPAIGEGPPGADGADGADGAPGADGEDGLSAYELAVAGGFVGTQSAWLESLEGPAGAAGADGADGSDGSDGAAGADGDDGASAYELAVTNGFVGTLPAWLASLQGADGADGDTGPAGAPGADGEDGAPGTTDYLELTNRPSLGTAASQNVGNFVQTASGSTATHVWVGDETAYAAIGSPSATTVYIVEPD